MGRKPKVDGETITEVPLDYDEAKHFITITLPEYYELIHDSELLRCLKLNDLESSSVYAVTMETFYPDNINPDDWRVER